MVPQHTQIRELRSELQESIWLFSFHLALKTTRRESLPRITPLSNTESTSRSSALSPMRSDFDGALVHCTSAAPADVPTIFASFHPNGGEAIFCNVYVWRGTEGMSFSTPVEYAYVFPEASRILSSVRYFACTSVSSVGGNSTLAR